jgi:tetratricopeptide (TPR) repeat protein
MLQGISSLLDKNLLKRVEVEGADVDPRFTMLETIREYALERLEESSERETIRRVHAEYYLAIAEAALPNVMGVGDQVWLDRLEQEIDNFRAAMGWAIENREAEMALSLAGALGFFFEIRSYFTEGINWLSRALAIYSEQQQRLASKGDEQKPSAAQARALWARGRLCFFTSEDVSARQDYQEALGVYRKLNDKWGMSATLIGLSQQYMHSGDYETAYKHMEESLVLRREMSYKIGEANSLWTMGLVLGYMGEFDKGIASLEQALDLARQLGSKYVLAGATRDLGEVLALKGDYERAAELYNGSIPLFRELRDPEALMWALIGLGYVRLRQGDRPEAEELFRESLEIMRELGTHKRISPTLEGMAQIAVERSMEEDTGDHSRRQSWLVRAARLLGAAESQAAIGRSPLPAYRRAEHDSLVARVSRLTGESFEREFEQGQSLSLHDMVQYALQSPS